MLPELTGLPLTALMALFAFAAGVVWMAGTRLAGYADEFADRTRLGHAIVGALLLGGITSLPELATSLTASFGGDANMAVNNLLGGIAMQVAILGVADAALRDGPLSRMARSPAILLQGAFLVLVLCIVMGGLVIGEPAGLPVGAWSAAVLVTAVIAFAIVQESEGQEAWRPLEPGEPGHSVGPAGPPMGAVTHHEGRPRRTLRGLVVRAALAAAVILVAGYTITRAGEEIASRTDLGSSFVGVALIAASTSLPEVSTTLGAVRLGRFDLAFGNIFGANILDAGLIFVVDLAYDGPPVLGELDEFALVAALLGILLTTVYVAGIIRGRVRTFGRLGADSLAVLVLYLAGLYALFTLR